VDFPPSFLHLDHTKSLSCLEPPPRQRPQGSSLTVRVCSYAVSAASRPRRPTSTPLVSVGYPKRSSRRTRRFSASVADAEAARAAIEVHPPFHVLIWIRRRKLDSSKRWGMIIISYSGWESFTSSIGRGAGRFRSPKSFLSFFFLLFLLLYTLLSLKRRWAYDGRPVVGSAKSREYVFLTAMRCRVDTLISNMKMMCISRLVNCKKLILRMLCDEVFE
jgi:hypothetical protein